VLNNVRVLGGLLGLASVMRLHWAIFVFQAYSIVFKYIIALN